MVLVKRRLNVVDNIIKERATTGYIYTDVEICVLQIRKVIELISMGSMISNIDKYSEIRSKFNKDWNARLIFREIEKINCNFYPEPIIIDKSGACDRFIPIELGFLRKDKAIEVYDKCNKFLHTDNPFETQHDVSYYIEKIPEWRDKIIRLLNTHLVHICDGYMFYVVMKSDVDGNPWGNIFEEN